MRAWRCEARTKRQYMRLDGNHCHAAAPTHPHLSPLNLPLVTILLVPPPLALKVMQHASEGIFWRLVGATSCVLAASTIRSYSSSSISVTIAAMLLLLLA